VIVGVVVGAAALFGADGAAQDGRAERGLDLFGQHCATCHGDGGRGTEDGPPIVDAGPALTDFMLRTGRMPLADPDARMVRGEPAFGDDDREALVAYVASLGAGPPIPEVDGREGDVAAGRAVFAANCAACHGPTGAGGAVGGRAIAPALGFATPLELAESVRTGPGVMPVFGPEQLDDSAMAAVIAYVDELRDRPEPAGIAFGRSGPVTEGLVAWTIGAISLLTVTYLLGSKDAGGDDD